MQPRILLGLLALIGTTYASPYSLCFHRMSRRSMSNYAPMAEYHLVAPSTCMQNCIMAAGNPAMAGLVCQSFTYNSIDHSCRLFDHNGYKVPAVVHPAMGVDFFTRTSTVDNCKGPIIDNKGSTAGNPNFHKLRNEDGVAMMQNKVHEIAHVDKKKERKMFEESLSNFRTFDEPNHKDEFSQRLSAMQPQDPIIKIDADVKVPATTAEPEKNTDGTCTTSNAYYVVLGTEIQKGEETDGLVQELMEIEQGDCARLCSGNVGINNDKFDCKSLNYYPAERKCELYSIQVEPNGPGKFLANPNTIYSEKFCIPASQRICQDDEVFILHVQKDIRGRLLDEQPANGITPCLQLCLNTDDCKSAVYKDEPRMCSLFAEDLGRNPRALKDTEPGAVAIENSCAESRKRSRNRGTKTYSKQRKTKMPSSSEDSEWSACSFKVDGELVKVRMGAYGDLEVKRC